MFTNIATWGSEQNLFIQVTQLVSRIPILKSSISQTKKHFLWINCSLFKLPFCWTNFRFCWRFEKLEFHCIQSSTIQPIRSTTQIWVVWTAKQSLFFSCFPVILFLRYWCMMQDCVTWGSREALWASLVRVMHWYLKHWTTAKWEKKETALQSIGSATYICTDPSSLILRVSEVTRSY